MSRVAVELPLRGRHSVMQLKGLNFNRAWFSEPFVKSKGGAYR